MSDDDPTTMECQYGECTERATVRCIHPESGPSHRCEDHRMTQTGEW